jgi:hypothetical protein
MLRALVDHREAIGRQSGPQFAFDALLDRTHCGPLRASHFAPGFRQSIAGPHFVTIFPSSS